MNLAETFRPHTWDGVVGQESVKMVLDVHRREGGLLGRAYWIVGSSGTGKTTLARLIAAEVAEPWAVEEIDAADLDVDTCRRLERQSTGRPIGGRGWCVIVNEAGSLRGAIVNRLLTLLELETVERNMTVVFTTTPTGQAKLFGAECEVPAFQSRVDVLETVQDVTAFAKRAREVAQAIGQDGQPLQAYVRLAVECDCNLRAMLRRVERGEVAP